MLQYCGRPSTSWNDMPSWNNAAQCSGGWKSQYQGRILSMSGHLLGLRPEMQGMMNPYFDVNMQLVSQFVSPTAWTVLSPPGCLLAAERKASYETVPIDRQRAVLSQNYDATAFQFSSTQVLKVDNADPSSPENGSLHQAPGFEGAGSAEHN